MKKYWSCFLLFFALSLPVFAAAEIKFGALNIFSKTPNAIIYVDGENKGIGSVQTKEIQSGTHFIKIVTSDGTIETNIYANIIEVKPGELTTIYISEKGEDSSRQIKNNNKEVDVFKTKKILEYSKEMHTGWHLRLGYLSNLYMNLDSPSLDNSASAYDIGIGFKIALVQNIDFSLDLERSTLSSSKKQWYFMPLTANIIFSILPNPYFRGKQYLGLGIGYFMTNLENDFKQNLTALGYHVFYGIEVPASDTSAMFFEFGYHNADINRYSYSLNSSYFSFGYRWDILE